jgi:hypothetical protein
MVVRDEQRGGTHKDHRLEHFARMHDSQRQGTDGHEVDADDAMLGVQATGNEVLAVQPVEERPEDCGGSMGIAYDSVRHEIAPLPDQADGVARNAA